SDTVTPMSHFLQCSRRVSPSSRTSQPHRPRWRQDRVRVDSRPRRCQPQCGHVNLRNVRLIPMIKTPPSKRIPVVRRPWRLRSWLSSVVMRTDGSRTESARRVPPKLARRNQCAPSSCEASIVTPDRPSPLRSTCTGWPRPRNCHPPKHQALPKAPGYHPPTYNCFRRTPSFTPRLPTETEEVRKRDRPQCSGRP